MSGKSAILVIPMAPPLYADNIITFLAYHIVDVSLCAAAVDYTCRSSA